MKRFLVVHLIRWADRGWSASYDAYIRCEENELPWIWHRFWTKFANYIDWVALSLARRLDSQNHWMGAEMAEYGWWG